MLFISLVAFGCGEPNSQFCEAHPDDPSCPRSDAGTERCAADGDCAAPTPVCRVEAEVCVQCLTDEHCTGNKPICNTSANVCEGCKAHAECASGLCLVDEGSCADADDVAYVGGPLASDNTTCGKGSPCQTLVQALSVSPVRKYMKVTGVIEHDQTIVLDNLAITIAGEPGASIVRTNDGPVFDIAGARKVALVDLEITRTGGVGDGVHVAGQAELVMRRVAVSKHAIGISVDGGTLDLGRARVVQNTVHAVRAKPGTTARIDSAIIAENTGDSGALFIAGGFSISNTVVARNGVSGGMSGGIVLGSGGTFEFSTVADNTPDHDGIACNPADRARLTNSIILQSVSYCDVTYSLTNIAGTGNRAGDPRFLDGIDSAGPKFYRIGADSAARDMADPAAMLELDIDGESRPLEGKDVGADEFH